MPFENGSRGDGRTISAIRLHCLSLQTRNEYYIMMMNQIIFGGVYMGRRGVELLGVDVDKLLKMLNSALAEEWLAYYQYWLGARLMEGPMRSEIEAELLIHADQELGHAVMVVDRIIELDGTPVLTPADWMKHAACEYGAPEDPYVEVILQQNLDGERCAIQRYKELADFTTGKDHATHQMVSTILKDELEHEQEIEDWILDIERMKENLRKLRD